jgi:hypothetical protein
METGNRLTKLTLFAVGIIPEVAAPDRLLQNTP